MFYVPLTQNVNYVNSVMTRVEYQSHFTVRRRIGLVGRIVVDSRVQRCLKLSQSTTGDSARIRRFPAD
jgi:hypothetical protein